MMGTVTRALRSLVALALLAAACGGEQGGGGAVQTPAGAPVTVFLASSDLYAGAPQRVGVGLVYADGRLVSFGEVAFAFTYTGTSSNPIDPVAGPTATATYLATPGTDAGEGASPRATNPSEARGIYQAEDVTFDQAGIWILAVTAELPEGPATGSATILVDTEARIPAPGQPALATTNHVLGDDVDPVALDSRAASGDVPDPELHATTIADAIASGRPTLVLFATPVYCQSQFCGPVTDVLSGIAADYGDRANVIHVEIWEDFTTQTITDAAAEWLYRNGDLTEPWLYLIGADGTILDRWTPLFDEAEVRAELDAAL